MNIKMLEKFYSPVGHIRIVQGVEPGVKDSKFGGHPYWPKDTQYPVNFYGERLAMIAQINCKDVPSVLGWPEKGILQFFIHAGDYEMGRSWVDTLTDCAIRLDSRVIYHDNIDLKCQKISLDFDLENLPFDVSTALKIDIIEGRMLPCSDLSHLNPNLVKLLEGHEEDYEEYKDTKNKEFFGGLPLHQLGGFPSFIQGDPRDESQAQSKYANLLLQIDSDENNDICWGDYGTAQFLTSKKILKYKLLEHKYFTDVFYTWDCM